MKDVAKDGIDVLISNAGIAQTITPAIDTEQEVYEHHYRTNSLGPIFLTKALYPYLKLKETKHLIYVSSIAGSIGGFVEFTTSAYGQSKDALNYSVKEISFELGAEGFTAVAIPPGMIATDMGKGIEYLKEIKSEIAEMFKDVTLLSPEEGAKALLQDVILKVNKESNGKFIDYEGKELSF